jgi:hypothetical protein
LSVFIFGQLKTEFCNLKNREPNDTEIIAIQEKIVGIIGEMEEEKSEEED